MKRQSQPKAITGIIIFLVLTVFLIVGGLVGAYLYYQSQLKPVNVGSRELENFTITSGESPHRVAERLESEQFIKNAFVFKLYLKKENLGTQIQAGDFSLSSSMSVPQLAQALTKATAEQVSVTLLEGWRAEEAAEHLENKLTESGISFDTQTFLSLPEIREGRVFPDTYFFALDTNEQAIAKTIEANFNQKLATLESDIQNSPYSLDQILTMASIVEREARDDRAIVAGILWKRLENDWPLQADATLQYAKGYNRLTDDWWPEPLAVDKEIDSPYNTYANSGLPPAPIANPSLSSIEAAVNPQDTPYWFYITAPDGSMHYGETYDDHLDNVNRYLR